MDNWLSAFIVLADVRVLEASGDFQLRNVFGSPPPLDASATALFLDLDGTLAELEAHPANVQPAARRTRILRQLVARMEGRVALLTGRSLEEADRILEGAITPIAAVHGLTLRAPDGQVTAPDPSPRLRHARLWLEAVANTLPGLAVEDKGLGVALHYRQAPDAAEFVRHAVHVVADETGLVLQQGAMVWELKTAGPNKGDALKALLALTPFSNYAPVMVGDDLTDEDAFAAADEMGGYGVLVGEARPSCARFRLATVVQVLDWLAAGEGP